MIRSIFFALGMASVALGWCAGVVMAQTEPADPVDSLRTALGLAETDAERARLHVELARYYSGIQDGDRLAVHAQAGLRFAKREQIDSLSADAYELLGLLAYEEGEYDRALAMSDSAMALNKAASDPLGMAAAFNLRGVVFLERGACDESVAAYEAALARIDESDAPRYVETMLNLTRANATCGQFEIAIQGAERVIPIAQANGLQKAQGSLIDVVAYSYSVLGRHEEALQAYEGYEALLDDVGLPSFESAFYNNRALVYEAMGEYERAYAGYQKSHEIDVRAGQTRTLPESLLNLGSAAAGLGRHTEAIDYLEEAIETFEAREQILDLPDSYDRLAVSYAAVGQQQKAYASLRRAYVLRDSVLGREAQEAMAEMNARFETERIQRDLAETRLDAQAAENRLLWIIGLALAIIVIVGTGYAAYATRQRRLRLEAEKKRVELEYGMLRAQMNPHFLFNAFNSVQSYFLEGQPEMGSEFLGTLSTLMRRVLEHTRLPAVPLQDELDTLALYLEVEKARLRDRLDYSIEVAPGVEADLLLVPPLILQPFVENAIWHGIVPKQGPGHVGVSVRMSADDAVIECMIEDDGVGIRTSPDDEGHEPRGIGLTKERLGEEGSVSISARSAGDGAGAGTRVQVRIPAEELAV